MSSILISTAIFGLLGVAGIAIYVALYGSHRVFQERFSEMAIKLKLAEGEGLFAGDHESAGIARSLFQWALHRMPAPKASSSMDKVTNTLVRAGFLRSGALRIFQLIRFIGLALTGIAGMIVAMTLGMTGGRVLLTVVGSLAVGYFGPFVLYAPACEPASKGYFAATLRRTRPAGRLCRSRARPVRGDQNCR
jgi:hypothetical protein